MQRARKELRGLEERRKAREGKQEDTMRVDKQEKAARPKATVARLFGRAGKATPTVKAIRGAS